MKLVNVRKGQFVYYKNRLHKVYSVKPFFKKSVHLIRLEDFKQQLATAKEIDFYKPQHLDSFMFNHVRYTLDKTVKAEVGNYIIVINPKPDPLDQHHLNTIEAVSSVEGNGVITNHSNGIRFNEYWVMVPELLEGATVIDRQDPDLETDDPDDSPAAAAKERYLPVIGDICHRLGSEHAFEAMVIAIHGDVVHLGGNLEVSLAELADETKWSFVKNVRY
ncbi:hypothetical protein NCCP2716_22800 [Sporosarcina sp. NCCP-2716]|uniref:hypothetical protein n=1 Tax=Sporosarcina sp. NCCP-2716 TaxID=2943679 RepID=UPI00203D8396|nr:hypothetical protein [Sporosarcina sp. NCCP-2716]GKV69782.1 hypothetical protein NCCP2716_22800 [Sporosarcina sp. NCCP-2716]